jgi:hypothetical protein
MVKKGALLRNEERYISAMSKDIQHYEVETVTFFTPVKLYKNASI